jgi:hypothetical protein
LDGFFDNGAYNCLERVDTPLDAFVPGLFQSNNGVLVAALFEIDLNNSFLFLSGETLDWSSVEPGVGPSLRWPRLNLLVSSDHSHHINEAALDQFEEGLVQFESLVMPDFDLLLIVPFYEREVCCKLADTFLS